MLLRPPRLFIDTGMTPEVDKAVPNVPGICAEKTVHSPAETTHSFPDPVGPESHAAENSHRVGLLVVHNSSVMTC